MSEDELKLQAAFKSFEDAKNKFIAAANEAEEKGALLMLTQEEVQLLDSFRKFKSSLQKSKIFKWQTAPKGSTDESN